ncbi:hypothetical protein AwDysgo_05420 [Bacteroidales bacterium]|nr:hypothetical protein AwDysgo_05420 [Bacteroidales bacterium]
MTTNNSYSTPQLCALVLFRLCVGWHFAYEGIVKILKPNWTSYPYLMDSGGFLGDFFKEMAGNATILQYINILNEWSLLLIGLGLITGTLGRLSSMGALLLLGFYTLSHPSYIGASYMMPFEGSYLWIDKNIVEMAGILVLLLFPTSQIIGIDRFLKKTVPLFSKLKLI